MVCRSRVGIAVVTVMVALAGCGKDPEVAKREFMKSGDELMAQKKYHEAVVQYRNAIQQDQQFGEARFKLAEALAAAGDAPASMREYLRAADLLPGDARAQIVSGSLLLLGGQFEDAQARADKALDIDPNSIEALVLKANALAGLKKMDEALDQAEEAVRVDPGSAVAYSAVGMLRMMRGERTEAEKAFQDAIEKDPTSAQARVAFAQFLLVTNRRDAAEAQLQDVVKLDAQNLIAHRGLIYLYVTSNRAAQAEPHLEVLADLLPNSSGQLTLADYYRSFNREADAQPILDKLASEGSAPAAYIGAKLRLATMARARGETAAAAALVDQALAKEPSNPDALVIKAAVLVDQKKLDEALAVSKTAVEANPESASVHFALGRLQVRLSLYQEGLQSYARAVQINPQIVAADIAMSQLQLVLRRFDEAEQSARLAVKKAPTLLDAEVALVRALLAREKLAEADPLLRGMVARTPKSAIVHAQVGRLELARKNNAAARAAFERAIALSPTEAEALGGLALMDLQANRPEAATARINAALAASPQDVRLLLLSARAHGVTRDFATAEKQLKQIIAIDSGSLDAYGALVKLYHEQGRLDQALVELETLSKERPALSSPHTVRGMILQGQNKRPDAKAAYRKALALEPGAPVAANNLAWMMAEDNENIDEALQLAQAARAKAPESAEIADTLGWIFIKKGQSQSAIGPLKDAVQRDPGNGSYQYHLGFAYAKHGDTKLARATLEKALKLAPADIQSKEARDTLSFLASLGS
jgi:putative PEP-CTERM system TPR-repeat lipoprotein